MPVKSPHGILRNLDRLYAFPEPLRELGHGQDAVLLNEAKGFWENMPSTLLVDSMAQYACLGKVYWWHFCSEWRKHTLTVKLLETNGTVLQPLVRRNCLKIKNGSHVYITAQGQRAYACTYWYRQWEKYRRHET